MDIEIQSSFHTMPRGWYWVVDPCYMLKERWPEICKAIDGRQELSISINNSPAYTLRLHNVRGLRCGKWPWRTFRCSPNARFQRSPPVRSHGRTPRADDTFVPPCLVYTGTTGICNAGVYPPVA